MRPDPQIAGLAKAALTTEPPPEDFPTGRLTTLLTHGKARRIVTFEGRDAVLLQQLAVRLAEHAETRLPPFVYAYRKGFHAMRALRAFRRFLAAHRRAYAPKQRGLYVLRADIADYGDSIPLQRGAPVWQLVNSLPHSDWVARALQPTIVDGDQRYCRLVGVPSGSPIVPVIENLFLAPVDSALHREAEFYSRYGDDFLVATTDPKTPLLEILRCQLATLGLSLNTKKLKHVYFNGAGRSMDGFCGQTHIDYLGMAIDFRGRMRLTVQKHQDVWRTLQHRLRDSSVHFGQDVDTRARLGCEMIASALSERHAFALPRLDTLLYAVDDRDQLKMLDALIARAVAEMATATTGPRAFRRMPYRLLRQYGLPSLVVLRNLKGKTNV